MDPRIDRYVEAAAPFASPILVYFRQLVHTRVPDATETQKWQMPFFEHHKRPLAMMAAFKAHVGIGIFDGTLAAGGGMGQFGRLTDIAQFPADAVLAAMLDKAVALIDARVPTMRKARYDRQGHPPDQRPGRDRLQGG